MFIICAIYTVSKIYSPSLFNFEAEQVCSYISVIIQSAPKYSEQLLTRIFFKNKAQYCKGLFLAS